MSYLVLIKMFLKMHLYQELRILKPPSLSLMVEIREKSEIICERDSQYSLQLCTLSLSRYVFYTVELFLSQLAVYNKIKNTLSLSKEIEKFISKNLLHQYPNECCQCCCDCVSNHCCPQYNVNEFLFERNGPALTISLKAMYGDEHTHVDFTFGMFCKEFPATCKGM